MTPDFTKEAEEAYCIISDCFEADENVPGITHGNVEAVVEIVRGLLSEAYNRAIEDASNLMEEKEKIYKSPGYSYPNGCPLSQVLARSHAYDIRNLAKSEGT